MLSVVRICINMHEYGIIRQGTSCVMEPSEAKGQSTKNTELGKVLDETKTQEVEPGGSAKPVPV